MLHTLHTAFGLMTAMNNVATQVPCTARNFFVFEHVYELVEPVSLHAYPPADSFTVHLLKIANVQSKSKSALMERVISWVEIHTPSGPS
jgi:hypothetical protein